MLTHILLILQQNFFLNPTFADPSYLFLKNKTITENRESQSKHTVKIKQRQ